MISSADIDGYWKFVRLSGSPQRADRIRAEQAHMDGWFEVTNLVERGGDRSVDLILDVAQRAANADELAYVVADLVDAFLAAGGSITALHAAARRERPDLASLVRPLLECSDPSASQGRRGTR